jgi:hypothetical protein
MPNNCSVTGKRCSYIILTVTDEGTPRLTSYRRIILHVHAPVAGKGTAATHRTVRE